MTDKKVLQEGVVFDIEAAQRERDVKEAWNNYKKIWKHILEKDGKLDMDQLVLKLSDFSFLIENVPKVYDHITDGRFTKHFTDPVFIQSYHDEAIEKAYKEGYEDGLTEGSE